MSSTVYVGDDNDHIIVSTLTIGYKNLSKVSQRRTAKLGKHSSGGTPLVALTKDGSLENDPLENDQFLTQQWRISHVASYQKAST